VWFLESQCALKLQKTQHIVVSWAMWIPLFYIQNSSNLKQMERHVILLNRIHVVLGIWVLKLTQNS